MAVNEIINWGKSHKRKLFQIDGLGAVMSAVLLGIVLVNLESIFGIPKSALYILAALPCIFAIYDIYCYYRIEQNLELYLKAIAVANLLYCILSIGLAIYHRVSITILGWAYIIAEVIIICVLSYLELSVAIDR